MPTFIFTTREVTGLVKVTTDDDDPEAALELATDALIHGAREGDMVELYFNVDDGAVPQLETNPEIFEGLV